MNIKECEKMISEYEYLKGIRITYEGKTYEVEELVIGQDSVLFAIHYLLNRKSYRVSNQYKGQEDLTLFLFCRQVGFNTPFFVKLEEINIDMVEL